MAIFRNSSNTCAPGAISASPVMTTARNRTTVTAKRATMKRKSRRQESQRLFHWRSPAFGLFAGLLAGGGADRAFVGRIAGHPLLAAGHTGRRARFHLLGRLHVLGRLHGLGRGGCWWTRGECR